MKLNKKLLLIFCSCILFIILFISKKYIYESFNNNLNLFPLQFVHIPKNAGTSIEDSAKKENILWGFKRMKKEGIDSKNMFSSSKPWKDILLNITYSNTSCFPWHRTPDEIPEMYPKNVKLFAVVRNPYTKIVSAYKYNRGKHSSKKDLNNWIEQHVGSYHNGDNKNYNSCHILEQNAFTHGKRKVDHILRFEHLDTDFPRLMKRYNIEQVKLENKNKSNKNVSIRDLNKKSIDLINKVYKKDFELFGYKMI